MVVMIHARADPESLIPTVRRRVASLDRNLPIQSLRVFEKTLGAELERRRFSTVLLTSFSTLAMILAAVGIFDLLNDWVSVREAEIAIRAALGPRTYSNHGVGWGKARSDWWQPVSCWAPQSLS